MKTLLFVDPQGQGQAYPLRQTGGYDTYAIPSPDGHRLAFLEYTTANNVWMIENFQQKFIGRVRRYTPHGTGVPGACSPKKTCHGAKKLISDGVVYGPILVQLGVMVRFRNVL